VSLVGVSRESNTKQCVLNSVFWCNLVSEVVKYPGNVLKFMAFLKKFFRVRHLYILSSANYQKTMIVCKVS